MEAHQVPVQRSLGDREDESSSSSSRMDEGGGGTTTGSTVGMTSDAGDTSDGQDIGPAVVPEMDTGGGGWIVGNVRSRARRAYQAWVSRKQRVLNRVAEAEDADPEEARGWVPEQPELVAREVLAAVRRLYGEVVCNEGKVVQYHRMQENPVFEEYTVVARKLRATDPSRLSEPEKVAFFLNIYNALLLHAITALGQPSTILERMNLYSQACYEIGGLVYSLNDIEHGVLRRNRPSPAPFSREPFARDDPRLRSAVLTRDPRIHMALNCGANSCPALAAYESTHLDQQLDSAVSLFCGSEVVIHDDQPEVQLSMIFRWYQGDFGDGSVLDVLRWVAPHLPAGKKERLEEMLVHSEQNGGDIAVKYMRYDWSINDGRE
uniref:DUF547 domain-containing protein n=1 Tax=Compsopogon caeruleus TaxID=31354 RepID=A0A7S1TA91_9RHOD